MSDPIVHLPALRDRLKPAGESELRVMADVLLQWDEREANRRAVLGIEDPYITRLMGHVQAKVQADTQAPGGSGNCSHQPR